MADTTRPGSPVRPFVSGYNWFKNLTDRRPIFLSISFLIICILFLIIDGRKYIGNQSYDLRSFYSAAKVVFDHGQSPYNLAQMAKVLGPHVDFNPFLYPPSTMFIFFPLAGMSYAQACNAVLIINDLLYLSLMWIIPVYLLGFQPRKRPAAFLVSAIIMLYFNPTRWVINLGEVDILAFAAIAVFWILSRSQKESFAGFFLALAIIVKTYPIVLIPFLLLSGRWREIFHTFIWLVVTTVFAYIVLPQFIWHDWLIKVVPSGGYLNTPAGLFPPSSPWNQGLNGFFARIFIHGQNLTGLPTVYPAEKVVVYIAAMFVMILTAIAVWHSRKLRDSLDRCMIVTLPAIFLIAPFSYLQHLVYLIPTIIFLIFSRSLLDKYGKDIFYSLLAISALVIASPKTLPLEFYAVAILWGLTTFALISGKFELEGDKTVTPKASGEMAGDLSIVR